MVEVVTKNAFRGRRNLRKRGSTKNQGPNTVQEELYRGGKIKGNLTASRQGTGKKNVTGGASTRVKLAPWLLRSDGAE